MNAHTAFPPVSPKGGKRRPDAGDDPELARARLPDDEDDAAYEDEDDAPLAAGPDIVPSTRHDGWTPERQRRFLEAIAEGCTVEEACCLVRLSPTSAYAFRRRAPGAAFALGWRAANLLARERIGDTLLARALDGQEETLTRPNGEVVVRHRFDNRLAMAMLRRLDAQAEDPGQAAANHAARLVAQEFDAFLALVEADRGPARAGLFLATRAAPALPGDPAPADPDLETLRALARADRWCRTGAALPHEVAVDDLDPDARATWSAEQWCRAEAAGLVALAPPAPPPDPDPEQIAPAPQLPQLRVSAFHHDEPVWWDEGGEQWRTRFPPPAGFDGKEDGEFGEEGYSRALTAEEEAPLEAPWEAEVAARWVTEARERDAWFAALGGASDDPDEDELADEDELLDEEDELPEDDPLDEDELLDAEAEADGA